MSSKTLAVLFHCPTPLHRCHQSGAGVQFDKASSHYLQRMPRHEPGPSLPRRSIPRSHPPSIFVALFPACHRRRRRELCLKVRELLASVFVLERTAFAQQRAQHLLRLLRCGSFVVPCVRTRTSCMNATPWPGACHASLCARIGAGACAHARPYRD